MNLIHSLIPSLNRSSAACSKQRDPEQGPTVQPQFEIKENSDDFVLTVNLPGVTKQDLAITAEAETLRIVGKRSWSRPKDWTVSHRETSDATFALELEHDNTVNLDSINAKLSDGVLRLSLPKAEAIKSRRIEIS